MEDYYQFSSRFKEVEYHVVKACLKIFQGNVSVRNVGAYIKNAVCFFDLHVVEAWSVTDSFLNQDAPFIYLKRALQFKIFPFYSLKNERKLFTTRTFNI